MEERVIGDDLFVIRGSLPFSQLVMGSFLNSVFEAPFEPMLSLSATTTTRRRPVSTRDTRATASATSSVAAPAARQRSVASERGTVIGVAGTDGALSVWERSLRG